jgi:hypothetical protein
MEAFEQFYELNIYMKSLQPSHENDTWTYIWG